MDILGGCIGFFAAYFVVSERNDLDIGIIGFSMSYSIQVNANLTIIALISTTVPHKDVGGTMLEYKFF